MLGNRKSFKEAAIGYLCIDIFLSAGLAVYGMIWEHWIDLGSIIAICMIVGIGFLTAIPLVWRQAKNGEPVGTIYLHSLLPKKYRRWIFGMDNTDVNL